MKTVVIYVQAPQASRRISACASQLGLAQAVKAVDCAPALFVELNRLQVDVVLVDVALAVPDPVRFTRAVHSRFPRTGVLFAGAADPRTAAAVAAAGALGVIRAVSGNADELLVAFAQAVVVARSSLANAAGPMPRQRSPRQLSDREVQVLTAMCEGKHNAEIGRELFVAEDTVKTHAKRLYRKLGARDRAHAVAIAFRSGLIS